MTTLFLILLALTIYFFLASYEPDTECVQAIDADDADVAEIVED